MNGIIQADAPQNANYRRRLDALHEKTNELHLFEFWGDDPANEHQATDRLRADRAPAVPHLWKYR
ncbi:MAG TPA: hypothetical protein VL993_04145, partial [Stellaceae bacterium]|nr:hypothetical protein [Stellaceae bacterium]